MRPYIDSLATVKEYMEERMYKKLLVFNINLLSTLNFHLITYIFFFYIDVNALPVEQRPTNCLLRNWNTSHYDNRRQMLRSF